MTARAQRHDPCLGVALRAGGQRVVQPAGQGEVPDVVSRELQLPAAIGHLTRRQCHHAGVVDEQVQRPVPGGDESAHGIKVGEVESADAGPPVPVVRADIDGGPLAGGGVADGEHHLGARGGERSRGLDADA